VRFIISLHYYKPLFFHSYCRLQDSKVDMSGLQGAGKLWPGKDYVNFVHKDFVDVDIAFSGI